MIVDGGRDAFNPWAGTAICIDFPERGINFDNEGWEAGKNDTIHTNYFSLRVEIIQKITQFNIRTYPFI